MRNEQTNSTSSKEDKLFIKPSGSIPLYMYWVRTIWETDTSTWTLFFWIFYLIIPLLFLLISFSLWLYHWHQRKSIEENIALETLYKKRTKRWRREYKQLQKDLEQLFVHTYLILHLSSFSNTSEMSWRKKDILDHNFHTKFTDSKKE